MRELELVNRHITAQYLSRLASAGVIIFPDEIVFPVRPEFQDEPDPFLREWIGRGYAGDGLDGAHGGPPRGRPCRRGRADRRALRVGPNYGARDSRGDGRLVRDVSLLFRSALRAVQRKALEA